MGFNGTLYPPIVDNVLPLFTQYTAADSTTPNAANLAFNLSPFQDDTDQAKYFGNGEVDYTPVLGEDCPSKYSVQSTIQTQMTNTSAISTMEFPLGILSNSIDVKGQNNQEFYYSTFRFKQSISGSLLASGSWTPGQYYRVQMRLIRDPFVWNGAIMEPTDELDKEVTLPNGTTQRVLRSLVSDDSQFTYKGIPGWGFERMADTYLKPTFAAIQSTGDGNPLYNLRIAISRKKELVEWMEENGFVSEWSTIILVRAISFPTWFLNSNEINDNDSLTYNTPLVSFTGRYYIPEDGLEPETIDTIQYTLLDENSEVIELSDIIKLSQANTSNEFSYKFKNILKNGNYTIQIEINTRNSYKDILTFNLIVAAEDTEIDNISLSYAEDDAKGWILLTIDTTEDFVNVGEDTTYSFAICRTDSKTAFKEWEELNILSLPSGEHTTTLTDATAESGIWYKYALQVVNDKTQSRGQLLLPQREGEPAPELLTPVLPFYQHYYLTNSDGHLAISFNGTIDSYKNNVQEAKIDTIGSRYPFVYRNDTVNYRTLQLHGTISYNDNNETLIRSITPEEYHPAQGIINNNIVVENINKGFKTKEDLFPDAGIRDLYVAYNGDNCLNDYNDVTLEREFRKEVISFLQSGKPMLLKSAAEGNILVRLIDFNFSPKTEIGNLVYDFDCQAIEIGECSIANYNRYAIQHFDIREEMDVEYSNTATVIKVGQA